MYSMFLIPLIWNVNAQTWQINTPNHDMRSLSGNNLQCPPGKEGTSLLSSFSSSALTLGPAPPRFWSFQPSQLQVEEPIERN